MNQLVLADSLGHLGYAIKIKLAGPQELLRRLFIRKAVLAEFSIDNIEHLFKGVDRQQLDRDNAGRITDDTIDIVSFTWHAPIGIGHYDR